MKKTMWVIIYRESGNRIDEFATEAEAKEVLKKLEESDEVDGIYIEDFYEIVESEID